MNIEFDDPDAHADEVDQARAHEEKSNSNRCVLVHEHPWPTVFKPVIQDEIECECDTDFIVEESVVERMMFGFFLKKGDPDRQIGNKTANSLTLDGILRMEIPIPGSALHVHPQFYKCRNPSNNLTDVARLFKAWWFRCKEIREFDIQKDHSHVQHRLRVAVSESIHNEIWQDDFQDKESDWTTQWMYHFLLETLSFDLLNYNYSEAIRFRIISSDDRRIPPAQLLIFMGMKSRIVKNFCRFQSVWNCFRENSSPNGDNVRQVIEKVKAWRTEEDVWNERHQHLPLSLKIKVFDSELATHVLGSFHFIGKLPSLEKPFTLSPDELKALPRVSIHQSYRSHVQHYAGIFDETSVLDFDQSQIFRFWNAILGRFGYRLRYDEENVQYEVSESQLMTAAKPWILNYDPLESIRKVFAPRPIPKFILFRNPNLRTRDEVEADCKRSLFDPLHINDINFAEDTAQYFQN